jgi:hypothetical protein
MLSGWPGRLLLTAAALTAAFVLFCIRETNRLRYASMELAFALVSLWYSVSALTKDPRQWTVVIASMYLIVRGLDNLMEGHKRGLIEWRRKGMNGTPEERKEFLKALFHGARFNGRWAIWGAHAMKKTQQEVLAILMTKVMDGIAQQAKETGYDAEQTELYIEIHRRAYESLAEEFGLNAPASNNS